MNKLRLFTILFFLTALFSTHLSFCQIIPEDQEIKTMRKLPGEIASPDDNIFKERGYPIPSVQAIETVINPDEYIVGPGDFFYINISGDAETSFPTQVTPEGKLVIQTIGTFYVNGKTLSEVQKTVREAGKTKYKLNIVTANLMELRTFRVHILGEVKNPGTYLSQAIDRASVLIDRAQSVTEWADERHVEIRHADGSIDTLDLFLFKKLGVLEDNLYMQNGDIIYVPAINLKKNTVTLEGKVTKPGIHLFNEGESLYDFLLRLNAFNRTLNPNEIYILRKADTGADLAIDVDVLGEQNDPAKLPENIQLKNGDRIFVPSMKYQVYVRGAVLNPGAYPYNAGFSARDYIGLAGGTQEMGNIKNIEVIHFVDQSIEKGPDAPVQRGDSIVVPMAFRKKFSEYLQILAGMATLVFAFMAAQN